MNAGLFFEKIREASLLTQASFASRARRDALSFEETSLVLPDHGSVLRKNSCELPVARIRAAVLLREKTRWSLEKMLCAGRYLRDSERCEKPPFVDQTVNPSTGRINRERALSRASLRE